MRGKVKGDMVKSVEGNLNAYDGCEVVITILNSDHKKIKEPVWKLDEFIIPNDRGMSPYEYVRRLRDDDRL